MPSDFPLDVSVPRELAEEEDGKKLKVILRGFDTSALSRLREANRSGLEWKSIQSLSRFLETGLSYRLPYPLYPCASTQQHAQKVHCPVCDNLISVMTAPIKEPNQSKTVSSITGDKSVLDQPQKEIGLTRNEGSLPSYLVGGNNTLRSTMIHGASINSHDTSLPGIYDNSQPNSQGISKPGSGSASFSPSLARSGDNHPYASEADTNSSVSSQSDVESDKEASNVIKSLSFIRDGAYFPRKLEWPEQPSNMLSRWICYVEYSDSVDPQLRAKLPQMVCPLGHLVVFGRTTRGEGHSKSTTYYCTPSWFTLVVELSHPAKPIWLISDRRYLGWRDRSELSDDDDFDQPYTGNDRDGQLYPPDWEAQTEPSARAFFNKLSRDADMIRLFSSLEEWDTEHGSLETIHHNLFKQHNRCKASPKLKYALIGDVISTQDARHI